MKKSGVINSALSTVLARVGHTDRIVVADAGFPCPSNVPLIDLALVPGQPTTRDVITVIASELILEGFVVAGEMESHSPHVLHALSAEFPGIPLEMISHDEFKALSRQAAAVIRSGDISPYSNILVVVGVPY